MAQYEVNEGELTGNSGYGPNLRPFYIIWPKNNANAHVAVVFLHGGGWSGGSHLDTAQLTLARALARHGAVVMVPDYTLASAVGMPTLPATMADIHAALQKVQSYTCVAGKPVALVGASAGGHLAALFCQTQTTDIPDSLVLVAAPVDLSEWALTDEMRTTFSWMLGASDDETLHNNSPLYLPQNANVKQLATWGETDMFLPLMTRAAYMTALGTVPVAGGVLIEGAGHSMDNRVEQWANIASAWIGCPVP